MKYFIGLSFFLFASSAVSADGWWLWSDQRWCFRLDVKKACLPDDYHPVDISTDTVKFVRRDPILPARFVKFKFAPLRWDGEQYPDESFTLSTEQKSRTVHLSKYIATAQSGGLHDTTLFIITLDNEFTLSLYGSDDDALSDLANSVVRQWKEK